MKEVRPHVRPSAGTVTYVVKVSILAATYVAAAKFGIEQDVAHGVITPVWAPSGIAIAALVLFGPRYWVGVALGAFLANATSGVAAPTAAAIAVGNTMEAVVAEALLRRAGFSPDFTQVRDVLWFVALAAVVATTASATIGVTSLTLADEIATGRYGQEWLLWWFGDLIGALLIAPPIMTVASAIRDRRWPRERTEALLLLAFIAVATFYIFVGGNWRYPYLIFPLLVWAALRFGPLGATVSVGVVGAIATWGTVDGAVPIGGATATQSVQILQGLIGIVGVSAFVTAATITERDTAVVEKDGALAQLRERNAMYETLLHAVSDLGEGFLVTDAGKLIYANRAYCEMTGYTFEELVALPSLLELTVPEQREEIAERLRSRLAGGNVVDHYEAALVRKDGRRVECEVAVELAETDQGVRLVSIVRDVTERKRIESFRDNFVSYAAHELREPIAIIAGFADLLDQPGALEDPAEAKPLLGRITSNVRAMRARIDNILALTRIERGDARLAPEVTDLNEALRSIAGSFPAPAGKTLTVEVAAGLTALVDAGALEQIVGNLLTNAYRYGGADVSLGARAGGRGVVIEVADDGTGLAPEDAERVFEPFVRGSGTAKGEGSGLGLAIVRALVEASGGSIAYHDAASGALFAVTLPA